MSDSERIQVILPRDTASRLRAAVPSRSRSAFITRAVERQLLIERQKAIAGDAGAPIWPDDDYPYLNTPEDTKLWLECLRDGRDADAALRDRYRAMGLTTLDAVGVYRDALRVGETEARAAEAARATPKARRRRSA